MLISIYVDLQGQLFKAKFSMKMNKSIEKIADKSIYFIKISMQE